MCKLGDVLRKLEELKRITDGGLGAEPPAAGGCGGLEAKLFLGKLAILMPMNHNSHAFRAS